MSGLLDFFAGVVPGYNSSPDQSLWNHDNGYQVPSTSETANQLSGSGVDPFGIVSGLWNDITGVTAQSREFSQQEYLQDKQNEYNKPINEMARMKEAGINPNVAASGIAGNGSPSASPAQVSSNTQGASNALQAASAGLQGFSQFGLNRSEIEKNTSIAEKTDEEKRLLGLRFDLDKDIAIGELAAKLVGIGIPELEAAIVAFDIGQGGYNSALNYLKGFQGIRQYTEKLSILEKEKELKIKELAKYDDIVEASISKDKAQAARDEKEAAKIEIETWFEEERKKIIQDIPALLFEGNSQLLYLAEAYGTDSEIWHNFQRSIYELNFTQYSAEMAAQLENAFNIAYDEEKAKLQVNADYAPYLSYVESLKDAMSEFYKSYLQNPRNVNGAIAKLFNTIFYQIGFQIGYGNNPVQVPHRPPQGHPSRKKPHPWE